MLNIIDSATLSLAINTSLHLRMTWIKVSNAIDLLKIELELHIFILITFLIWRSFEHLK